ncbi:hypothetical protein FHU13_005121 [Methylobacterium sp. R2-1]|nr:hypothetical protein [Methylobacterium sp. R2-1]
MPARRSLAAVSDGEATAQRHHFVRLAPEVLNQRLRITAIEVSASRYRSASREQRVGAPQHRPAVCGLQRGGELLQTQSFVPLAPKALK